MEHGEKEEATDELDTASSRGDTSSRLDGEDERGDRSDGLRRSGVAFGRRQSEGSDGANLRKSYPRAEKAIHPKVESDGLPLEAIQTFIQSQSMSGPLPLPQTLAGYEGVKTGLAERVVVMAENAQNASIDHDSRLISIEEKESMHRSVVSYILCGLAFSALLVVFIRPEASIGSGIIVVGSIAGTIANSFLKRYRGALPRGE